MEPGISPETVHHDPADTHTEGVLISWNAPARPFKKRNREFYTTVIAIAVLVGLILFFVEGPLLVAVVMSVVFLVYVLSSVPPEEVECGITKKGVVFAGKKYPWSLLRRFWFASRFGIDLLIFESEGFPGRVEMVVHAADKENIRKEIEKRIPYEPAAPNFLDRSASWLSKRVPLEG